MRRIEYVLIRIQLVEAVCRVVTTVERIKRHYFVLSLKAHRILERLAITLHRIRLSATGQRDRVHLAKFYRLQLPPQQLALLFFAGHLKKISQISTDADNTINLNKK